MRNDAAIELCNVTKHFGKTSVLDGLNLTLQRGSILGLLGTNGSGKTTLLKCTLGLLRPQSGTCRILGDDAWNLKGATKARLGYVPQVMSLYPWMKVKHHLDFVGSFYPRWDALLVRRLVREWELPENQRAGTLSVGQQQKLAIILALGPDPDVLVLDEPAASLDPLARRQFLQLIIDLCAPNERTVLFSTHITSDLERIADRVAVLKKGKIAWTGLLDDLKEQTHLNLEDSFLEMHHA